jgi:hypothetical protein
MNIKTHDARYVSFPFELKDAFREVFPNAKWNPTSREWQVVKGSEQRLVDWVKEVEASGILQAMLDQETARLSEEEVLQLQTRLSELKYGISIEENATERTENAKTRAEQLKEQLAGLEQQLHARKEARVLAEAEKAKAKAEVMTILRDVADVDEIECLRTGMKSDWRSIKAFNKDRFEEKQDRLSEIRDDLETAGLYSEALSKAISANYNRRDQDLPDLSIELEFEIDG